MKEKLKAIRNILHMTTRQKVCILCVIGFLCSFVFGWLFFGKELIGILENPELFRAWLDQFGSFDEFVFILVRAAQTVVKFIPAEPLEIASGYAWGAILGMLYCVIGNVIGTLVIFMLTRRFGRTFVEAFVPTKKLETLEQFRKMDKLYGLLFLLYLIPGAPKDAFTYIVGLLPVKTVPFLLISFTARMPSVLSSTVCGVALAEKQYMMSLLIFGATILFSILGGLTYKAYQKRRLLDE